VSSPAPAALYGAEVRGAASDAAPYTDATCVIVPLVSTSLVWSDRTVPWQNYAPTASASAAAPRLRSLQLLLLECVCLLSHTQYKV